MQPRRLMPSLFLILAMLLLFGCTKKVPAEPQALAPSLELVRNKAKLALDNSAPSEQRAEAREEAVSTLIAFLSRPESLSVTRDEWERPLQGTSPLVRYYESGSVRVFAITLPGSGIVPPGERVVVQYVPPSGAPQASELKLMPGGRLVAARSLEESGQVYLTLACGVARGGGFVAHFQRDSQSGEFKQAASAFGGLPARIGNVSLEPRDGFLAVTGAVPSVEEWQPYFDEKRPQRLYVNEDVGLEWKGGFTLVDERNFSAFQGLITALDVRASKEDRQEAWEKATRKLPEYLREPESWSDELVAKLPRGARVETAQMSNLAVRLVSIPAPEFVEETGFTIVQQRFSAGMPSAQVLDIPGIMEGSRLIDRHGVPGLLVLSDSTPREQGAAPVRQKSITLLRLSGGNTWEPAPDWFGPTPKMEGLALERPGDAAFLTIQYPATGTTAAVALGVGSGASVELCAASDRCAALSLMDGQLTSTDGVSSSIQSLVAGKVTTDPEFSEATAAIAEFLETKQARTMTSEELAQALGRSAGLAVAVLQADAGTRVIGLPAHPGGRAVAFIQAEGDVSVESADSSVITEWSQARVIEAGGNRWLIILGRSRESAGLILYQWRLTGWKPANALATPLDRTFGSNSRVTYTPGQTAPIRGLHVSSIGPISVSVHPDSRSVSYCDSKNACITYQYTTRWLVK